MTETKKVLEDVRGALLQPQTDPNTKAVFSIVQLDKVLSNIVGRVLTTAEAVMPEGKQLKATKDLLEQAVWSDRKELYVWANEQNEVYGSSFPLWNPPRDH